jgi:GNAT superfamily N-acetyltransferase
MRAGEFSQKALRAASRGRVVVWSFLRMRTEQPIRPYAGDPAVQVTLATPEDVGAMVALRPKESVFRARFARGEIGQIARLDGRVVGYRWMSDGPMHREERYGFEFAIPEDCMYAYDVYVDPAIRQRGVWRALWHGSAAVLEQQGRRRLMSLVDPYNVPSVRGHHALGYRVVGRGVYLRCFGWSRVLGP